MTFSLVSGVNAGGASISATPTTPEVELEKVETYLSGFESYVEEEDKALALNEIDKTEFVLEHISNKYKFNMENIF